MRIVEAARVDHFFGGESEEEQVFFAGTWADIIELAMSMRKSYVNGQSDAESRDR